MDIFGDAIILSTLEGGKGSISKRRKGTLGVNHQSLLHHMTAFLPVS